MRGGQQHGFTLLEMLVAITIFALVSALVYGGQVAILKAKEGTERQAYHLKQLQSAMLLFERDIGQHLLRPVRDEFGDSRLPLESAGFGVVRLALTRAGWQNPLHQPRSTLQRVAYGLEDGRLQRYSWSRLDRVQGDEPYKVVLLESVRGFTVRFLDQGREWQEQWPVQGTTSPVMPLAVELTLELEEWGTFRRLIPTAGHGPTP
ncbi:MAG: type II secretion system minor pseudopilin GspJ [Gammaproteobacteria bacterium]|nr:type II secretion system minor pseudopilin GspJ [Gammaproteobacteria bacterium]